jgi:uncharacterized membrane protein YgdD (TMEM256/DUF423 family)
MPDRSFWLLVGGISGALAVGLGAFGAHGLKNKQGITDRAIKTWETAAHYHLIHSVCMINFNSFFNSQS